MCPVFVCFFNFFFDPIQKRIIILLTFQWGFITYRWFPTKRVEDGKREEKNWFQLGKLAEFLLKGMLGKKEAAKRKAKYYEWVILGGGVAHGMEEYDLEMRENISSSFTACNPIEMETHLISSFTSGFYRSFRFSFFCVCGVQLQKAKFYSHHSVQTRTHTLNEITAKSKDYVQQCGDT